MDKCSEPESPGRLSGSSLLFIIYYQVLHSFIDFNQESLQTSIKTSFLTLKKALTSHSHLLSLLTADREPDPPPEGPQEEKGRRQQEGKRQQHLRSNRHQQ